MGQTGHEMSPTPRLKSRPKGKGLWNKECCPPSSSLQGLTSLTYNKYSLKGIQGEDQDDADTLCSGKTGRTGPQMVSYFQEKILISEYLERMDSGWSLQITIFLWSSYYLWVSPFVLKRKVFMWLMYPNSLSWVQNHKPFSRFAQL